MAPRHIPPPPIKFGPGPIQRQAAPVSPTRIHGPPPIAGFRALPSVVPDLRPAGRPVMAGSVQRRSVPGGFAPAAHRAGVPDYRSFRHAPPDHAPPPVRRAQIIQRSSLGFDDLNEPTGYGSVSLSATLNGIDLGKAWSRKTTYAEDTEHAEDSVADIIEQVEMFIEWGEYPNPLGDHAGLKPLIEAISTDIGNKERSQLVINNLTASPCSTKRGTCKKKDHEGCAERLIALLGYGHYDITVNADHYYQPTEVGGDSKGKSKSACEDMGKAGITVNVAKK
jgi:hypothetical protein